MRRGLLFGLTGATLLSMAGSVVAHEPSENAKQRMLDGDWLDFVWIGAEHMLTGYDHLLFLLGVLFFLTRPLDVARFVTAFTLGHTVTLLFATLLRIRVDPYLIDAVIALTVIYKAVENLDGFRRLWRVTPPPLLPMVFAFGLIHGLGLSTRLQQMTLTTDPGLVGKILMFNVGVELGQIAALLVMGLALIVWRQTAGWTRFATVINGALILAGAGLLIVQVHGFLTQPGPEAPDASASATLSPSFFNPLEA